MTVTGPPEGPVLPFHHGTPGSGRPLRSLLPPVDQAVITDEFDADLADSFAEGLRSGVEDLFADQLGRFDATADADLRRTLGGIRLATPGGAGSTLLA